MYLNYLENIDLSNLVSEDFRKVVRDSRHCDGNPEDEFLVKSVRKFSKNFKNSNRVSLGIIKCVVELNLSSDDIIWFSQSLPIFKSHGYITEEQYLRISDIISRIID